MRIRRVLVLGVAAATAMALLPPASQAVASTTVKVTVSLSRTSLVGGQYLTVRGRATPARTGSKVTLQRRYGGLWHTIRTTKASSADYYRFRFRPPVGGFAYRVRKPADGPLRAAVSRTVRPHVADPCPALPRPKARTNVYFTRPEIKAISPITRMTRGVICAAARGATIRVAMYYIKIAKSRDVDVIVDALQWVKAHRGVHTQIILDTTLYRGGEWEWSSTLRRLRSFAQVVLCLHGCRDRRPMTMIEGGGEANPELQHNKFIVVSNTRWRTGTDPAVIQSSANWSMAQLRVRHQSALLLRDDPVLAREYNIRWQSLRTCALADRHCAAWNSQLSARGLSRSVYSVANQDGIWIDPFLGERHGAKGRGFRVSFTPWVSDGSDPLANQLNRFTCTSYHHTVRVGHMFIARSRPQVIAALDELGKRGCDVRIIVSSKQEPAYVNGIAKMREAGLYVRCVPNVHDKYVLMDGRNTATGKPERVLWTGSQSVAVSALRHGDEANLRMSVSQASPRSRSENAAVWNRFKSNWWYLFQRRVPCPTP